MAVFQHTPSMTTPTGSYKGVAKQYTATKLEEVQEVVADGETDFELDVDIVLASLKAIYVYSDQDVTLETNSSSAPDDTIALKAGIPYIWTTDSYDALMFTEDITAVFITNASGEDANVKVLALNDATP